MAKDWPSRSSNVVFARRVWRPGIVSPLMTTEADGSIELTSGATTRLMRPSSSTVGVKPRLTPKGLNSTVIERLSPPPPPPPPPLSCDTGIGNSPPARKRSEEHTSELQSLMRISYAVFCLKKKQTKNKKVKQ